MCESVGVQMQVQSISNQAFEARKGRRDNIDAMIKLEDSAIQQKAYEKTLKQIDPEEYKRNKRITNTLFYTAPVAAGISRMLLTDSSATTLLTKKVSGVAGRMAKGLKTTAALAAIIGALDLMGAVRTKIARKSEGVREFDKKHPALSFMTTIGAGIAVITALPLGFAKAGNLFTPKFTNKVAKKVGNVAKKINNSNTVDVLKNGWRVAGEKTPNWIKTIGAVALDWSPAALLLGSMFNSLRGSNERTADFVEKYNKNYSNLKEKQVKLSRARLQEISIRGQVAEMIAQKAAMENAMLAVQNDFLMSYPENRYEMNVLADGARYDMPQEVVEKVDSLRANRVSSENADDEDVIIPEVVSEAGQIPIEEVEVKPEEIEEA